MKLKTALKRMGQMDAMPCTKLNYLKAISRNAIESTMEHTKLDQSLEQFLAFNNVDAMVKCNNCYAYIELSKKHSINDLMVALFDKNWKLYINNNAITSRKITSGVKNVYLLFWSDIVNF